MGRIGWVTGFTEVHCTWKHNTGLQGNTSNSSMLNVVNSDLLSECFPSEHETDLKKTNKTPTLSEFQINTSPRNISVQNLTETF